MKGENKCEVQIQNLMLPFQIIISHLYLFTKLLSKTVRNLYQQIYEYFHNLFSQRHIFPIYDIIYNQSYLHKHTKEYNCFIDKLNYLNCKVEEITS